MKKNRRSTTYKVVFPTIPTLEVQPRRVDLFQKKLKHDVLALEYPVDSAKWENVIQTGVPVTFTWVQNGISNTFFGYVSYMSREVASQQTKLMKVHCIGSSFPLKEKTSRVFLNTSIPNAVKTIVTEYGFNFIGQDNSAVFEQLVIAGTSTWEWIVEQAVRIGYCVIVDGLDFIFKPIDSIIDQSVSNAPVLSFTESDIPIGNQQLDKTLDYFEVINGELVETDRNTMRTIKLINGVNPFTTELVSYQAQPDIVGKNVRNNVGDSLFSEQITTQVVPSQQFAEVLAEGAAHMARLSLPARVKCQGDPRIKPYFPVYISGTGNTTDGYWVAKEVRHLFHRIGEYQIEMTVVTDGIGTNNFDDFRSQKPTLVGAIDVNAALDNGVNTNGNSRKTNVYLETKNQIILESNQGFKRTPTRWKAGKPYGN
jgi:phage protein D